MPKISFLVSTYNSEKYIDRSIRNLMQQTEQDFEIIIVNPNSQEKDGEIAQKWAEKDDRVKYIYVPYRENYGCSWIKAWKSSRAGYVANANTDDLRSPNFAESCIKVLNIDNSRIPKIGFVYSGLTIINEDGNILGYSMKPEFDQETFERECWSGPSVCWRRDLIDELDIDKLEHRARIFRSAFDYYLFQSILKAGYTGYRIPALLVQYTQRSSSIENSSNSSTWQSLCIIGENYPEALDRISKNEGNELALHFKSWPLVPELESFNEALRGNKVWNGKKINMLEMEKL